MRFTKLVLVSIVLAIGLYLAINSGAHDTRKPKTDNIKNPKAHIVKDPVYSLPLTPGKVIYLRVTGNKSDSPSDVKEINLFTGQIKTLISHVFLPHTFKSRIGSISPSPDDKYLNILGSSAWVFRDNTTRKAHNIYGNTITYDPTAGITQILEESDWCWERGKGVPTKIVPPSECTGSSWWAGDSVITWSPKGNKLLGRRDHDEQPDKTCLYIYNPKTKVTQTLSNTRKLDIAVWSGDGKGVIKVRYTKKEKTIVSYSGLNGTNKQLFKWPRQINSIAQSPDTSRYAVYDAIGCYLLSANGRLISKLKIPVKDESFYVDFRFNRNGNRLAVLTSYSYGEPCIGLDQELWAVDMKSRQSRSIAKWTESFLGSNQAVSRRIEEWLPDQRSIAITGAISYGEEQPADSRNDWIQIWTYDTASSKPAETEIFDSGKGCLGVAFWPGD